ncbi:inward rectifier potassium channel 2 [Aplysia californica]|uniref:Inward rectifier potassium channel 2 n=1 Tax=Aplysia californica TaxID=6500 RepID=A0ABM0JPY0_APLCA|nr:inward rectifier potassium channel 2 [Aplysia californica]XP_005098786.1 inward rectifier potassium channel 2 [Aplysia californica]XP_005098787.1 inward rectifier potassium channel 2 [Aplysia californica]XP_005098788.1 inward rectifier potassium channel 2 [Aplysia californica]
MNLCRRRRQVDRHLSRKRLMRSAGHNIVSVSVPDKHRKYMSDIYTTLIDIQWRWNILIFVGVFVFTWVIFACFYYLLGSLHGDLETNSTITPCVENVNSFTSAYLFSIETMTTIGYGFRSQTEECPGVFLAVMLQSILGAGLQFALASVVVSKTRRAKRRSGTVLFSDKVCIYEDNTHLQLSVRVGDMRKSEIAGAHAKGFLIKKYRSHDGTFVPVRSYQVSFKAESGRDEIFLSWPTQILHKVDEASALWSLSRDELLSGKYELIVVIDGVCVSTSTPFQARKSYHTTEMVWGHRFSDLGLSLNCSGSYDMDLSNFNGTVPASTPLCSAQDINHLREMYRANHPDETVGERPNEGSLSKEDVRGSQVKEKSSKVLMQRRSHSMEEATGKPRGQHNRRCSLGDLIRTAQGEGAGGGNRINHLGNALNIYRHRLSVTDTYLGSDNILEEVDEDDDENNQAILTVVSQRSQDRLERRTDVRDVFKKKKSSVTQLFFGTEPAKSGEEGIGGEGVY